MKRPIEDRPTPLLKRARISNYWFEQILLGFLYGLSAQDLIDAFEEDGDKRRTSPPQTKTIARIAAGLGSYIYDKILRQAMASGVDDPGALLEEVLAGRVPAALHAMPWEGEALDITDELARSTKALVQTRRSAYPDTRSLLGRAALEAVFYARAANRNAQIEIWKNALSLVQEQKIQIDTWLKEEPLDLAQAEREPNASVPATRLRHAGNPFVHGSKLSAATTQKLIRCFLMGMSAEDAWRQLHEAEGTKIKERIPSTKTINDLFGKLGHRLFERLFSDELKETGELEGLDEQKRIEALEEHAKRMLRRSLDALPYDHFRIIAPEDGDGLCHTDMHIEVRKVFARRRGLSSDPMSVMALARFRSSHAESSLLYMHTMLCGWLIEAPL